MKTDRLPCETIPGSELPSWLTATPRRRGGRVMELLRFAGGLLYGLVSIPLMLVAAVGLAVAVYVRCFIMLFQVLAAPRPAPVRAEHMVLVHSIARQRRNPFLRH